MAKSIGHFPSFISLEYSASPIFQWIRRQNNQPRVRLEIVASGRNRFLNPFFKSASYPRTSSKSEMQIATEAMKHALNGLK